MDLFVLCGIPGSGKSTYAKRLAEQHDTKLYCFDSLPNAHHPKYARAVHEQMWAAIAEDLRNGFDVVCDDLHTKKQWRRDILSAASGVDCQKILVVMNTPLDECLRRNANREARLPEFVVTDLHHKYEPPEVSEGWDEIMEVKTYEPNFTGD